MKNLSDPRFLSVYSGVVTAALLIFLLSGFAPAKKKAHFDEIDVQRVNIVEPDGTVRAVLSDRTRFPGLVVRGKERPYNRSVAGLIFYNEEGTENGGLIFRGHKGKDGKVSASGSLTFDQYEQDQVVQLTQTEDDGQRLAGLKVNDQPEGPLDLDAKPSAANAARQRLFVGKRPDHSAVVVLRDPQERIRLLIQVAADGAPSIQFFDESGAVVGTLPASAEKAPKMH